MNSARKLLDALSALDESTISPQSPRRIAVDSQLGEWELVVEQADALAFSLSSLAVASPDLRNKEQSQLKQISQQLADRLQYLLEPIALIECDLETATMQVRSDPPSEDEDQSRCYYELLVKQQGLVLKRFRTASGAKREPIAMTLTAEQIRRLCNDFEDVIVS